MEQQIESVGKVFEVVGGKRRCLVCEGTFTPTQAATHAVSLCYPQIRLLDNIAELLYKTEHSS
jgi:hypothetical protein